MANSLLPLMNQTTADLEMPDESPSAGVGITRCIKIGSRTTFALQCLNSSLSTPLWAREPLWHIAEQLKDAGLLDGGFKAEELGRIPLTFKRLAFTGALLFVGMIRPFVPPFRAPPATHERALSFASANAPSSRMTQTQSAMGQTHPGQERCRNDLQALSAGPRQL